MQTHKEYALKVSIELLKETVIKSQIKMHKSCGIKMYNYSAKATQSFSL